MEKHRFCCGGQFRLRLADPRANVKLGARHFKAESGSILVGGCYTLVCFPKAESWILREAEASVCEETAQLQRRKVQISMVCIAYSVCEGHAGAWRLPVSNGPIPSIIYSSWVYLSHWHASEGAWPPHGMTQCMTCTLGIRHQ